MVVRNLLSLILCIIAIGCSSLGTSAYHSFRLKPGQDLKSEIELYLKGHKIKAAAIVSIVGSLTKARVRFANQRDYSSFEGHFEIVSLTGVLSHPHGSHLHMSFSNGKGKTLGGHLGEGNVIYTTAEIVLVELRDREFKRTHCPLSTFKELEVIDI